PNRAAAHPAAVRPVGRGHADRSKCRPADHHDRSAQRVQDVDRRRDSILHAGAERAVSSHFCLRSTAGWRAEQPIAAAESLPVQVRRGHHLLIRSADSPLTKGFAVMKGSALALTLLLSASSAFAQAPRPAPQAPARPAPTQPTQTIPRPATPAPTAPA